MKFKIGIDYHGVFNKNIEFFIQMYKNTITLGGELHLVTGARKSTFDREVNELFNGNVPKFYTHFFSISDYHVAQGYPVDLTLPDNPKIHDKIVWDRTKGDYAKKVELNIMYDDCPDYAKYFDIDTLFVLCKNENNMVTK